MAAEFELYEDENHPGQYRWRLQAGNNKIIAGSGEGYATRAGAREGIDDVKRVAPSAPVNDRT